MCCYYYESINKNDLLVSEHTIQLSCERVIMKDSSSEAFNIIPHLESFDHRIVFHKGFVRLYFVPRKPSPVKQISCAIWLLNFVPAQMIISLTSTTPDFLSPLADYHSLLTALPLYKASKCLTLNMNVTHSIGKSPRRITSHEVFNCKKKWVRFL